MSRKLLLGALLIGGVLVVLGVLPYRPAAISGAAAPTNPTVLWAASPALAQAPALTAAGAPSVADIAEQTVASVVNIASSRKLQRGEPGDLPFFMDPFFRDFFGGGGMPERGHAPQPRAQGLGSGVIISADGIVLTNNHVVADSDQVRVTLSDKREFDAQVVGTDPKSDLAVLRLKGNVKNLRPLSFGDSNALRLGETVLAFGNPFGVGQTVTMGIVSAKGRANVGIVDYEDFIQTDAAINPGNSGGALINLRGELVGINTAIASRSGGYQGVGFAIPSNMARPIMESLLKNGKVVRGWLGVIIQDLNAEMAEALGLSAPNGVLVSDVVPDGPAAKAGVLRGDVIAKINGEPVDSTGRLRNLVAAGGTAAKVRLEVLRSGKTLAMEVKLGEAPAEGRASRLEKQEGVLGGLSLAPLDAALREKYHVPRQIPGGVVVLGVEAGSAVQASGLREGDVILEMNRQRIDSVEQFRTVYGQNDRRLLLLVYRQGATVYLLLSK